MGLKKKHVSAETPQPICDKIEGGPPFEDLYDYYYRIDLPRSFFRAHDAESLAADINSFACKLMDKLGIAMGERFSACKLHRSIENDLVEPAEKKARKQKTVLVVGFSATSEWSNPLTIGPIANEPQAQVFRNFWDSKTELRRFGDNSIKETIMWAEEAGDDVSFKVFSFVLRQHFGVEPENLTNISRLESSLLPNRKGGEKLKANFAELSGYLRGLSDLPLKVTTITGTSPYLRGTEPNEFAALVAACKGIVHEDLKALLPSSNIVPNLTKTVEVFIRLEYSHKWGNDVELIRQLIISFYILIAEQLKAQHKLDCHPTPGALYIRLKSTVFRVIIVNEKILAMLRNQIESQHMAGIDTSAQNKRLKRLTTAYRIEPAIKAQLGVLALKHQHFSSACQLFKRWLGRQMLSGRLHEITEELLVAAAFDKHSGKPAPSSAFAGFRRALQVIVEHDWLKKPLIVDLDGQWPEEERMQAMKTFVAQRIILPPMVICTQEDPSGALWTAETPSALFTHRLMNVAAIALTAINGALRAENDFVTEELFHQSPASFDAWIHLHREFQKAGWKARDAAGIRELQGNLPVVDFNPLELFVERLNNHFGSVAFFLYDRYNGKRIGIKWRGDVTPMSTRIARAGGYKLDEDNFSQMTVNQAEIVETIGILGQGMVSKITTGNNEVLFYGDEPDFLQGIDIVFPAKPPDEIQPSELLQTPEAPVQTPEKEVPLFKEDEWEVVTEDKTPVSLATIHSSKDRVLTPEEADAFIRDENGQLFFSPSKLIIIDSSDSSDEADMESKQLEKTAIEIEDQPNPSPEKESPSIGKPTRTGLKKSQKEKKSPHFGKQTVASKMKRKSTYGTKSTEPAAPTKKIHFEL
ncbi:unnamed protein product, partial [Mesorhabditis spiculigera]